jgi:hypothetical protein
MGVPQPQINSGSGRSLEKGEDRMPSVTQLSDFGTGSPKGKLRNTPPRPAQQSWSHLTTDGKEQYSREQIESSRLFPARTGLPKAAHAAPTTKWPPRRRSPSSST